MGPVEAALRKAVGHGEVLATVDRGAPFRVWFERESLILELGRQSSRPKLPWETIETIPGFLRGRGWVVVGGSHSVDGLPGTLDAYLKEWQKTDVARWLVVPLQKAGVVEIERRPLRVRLDPNWS